MGEYSISTRSGQVILQISFFLTFILKIKFSSCVFFLFFFLIIKGVQKNGAKCAIKEEENLFSGKKFPSSCCEKTSNYMPEKDACV